MRARAIVSTLSMVAMVRTASAEAMRCGTRWIEAGTPLAEVIEHCGPPTRVQALPRWRRGARGEIWTYDRGPTSFVVTLLVSPVNVVWVAVGSYGSTAP